MDAWAALREPKPYAQSFTARSYRYDECRSCLYTWNRSEHDGITVAMEARKPTLMERVVRWFK